jgi:hypothetical protein
MPPKILLNRVGRFVGACVALAFAFCAVWYLLNGKFSIITSIVMITLSVILVRAAVKIRLIPNPVSSRDRDFTLRPFVHDLVGSACYMLAGVVAAIPID